MINPQKSFPGGLSVDRLVPRLHGLAQDLDAGLIHCPDAPSLLRRAAEMLQRLAEHTARTLARIRFLERHPELTVGYEPGDPDVGCFPYWEVGRPSGCRTPEGLPLHETVAHGTDWYDAIDEARKSIESP